MSSGQLTASGTLFLTTPIYSAMVLGGAQQYVLHMLQRGEHGVGNMRVVGIWQGAQADAWMAQHRHTCKAGKALTLTFSRLFSHNNEIHGVVSGCELAPERWPARDNARGATAPTSTTTNSEQEQSA